MLRLISISSLLNTIISNASHRFLQLWNLFPQIFNKKLTSIDTNLDTKFIANEELSLSFGLTIYNSATHFLTADLAIAQKICMNFFHKMEIIRWKNNLYYLKD